MVKDVDDGSFKFLKLIIYLIHDFFPLQIEVS